MDEQSTARRDRSVPFGLPVEESDPEAGADTRTLQRQRVQAEQVQYTLYRVHSSRYILPRRRQAVVGSTGPLPDLFLPPPENAN